MKKLFITLSVAFAMTMVSCGGGDNKGNADSTNVENNTPAEVKSPVIAMFANAKTEEDLGKAMKALDDDLTQLVNAGKYDKALALIADCKAAIADTPFAEYAEFFDSFTEGIKLAKNAPSMPDFDDDSDDSDYDFDLDGDTTVVVGEDIEIEAGDDSSSASASTSSDSSTSSNSNSSTSSSSNSSTSASSNSALLDEYEKYVNDYVAIYKKVAAGDMTAAMQAMEIAEKAQALSEKLSKANLSTADLTRLNKITQKMANAMQ